MIVDSPVGMPGRAIRNRFLEEKESRRESIKKCYQCIATCNPANTPYCITRALVHAAKGETDDALLFCGENAWRCEKDGTCGGYYGRNLPERKNKEI